MWFFNLCCSEEKKSAAKPQKKFLASDLRNMHDILSKNMYKIRQRVRNYVTWQDTAVCTLPSVLILD